MACALYAVKPRPSAANADVPPAPRTPRSVNANAGPSARPAGSAWLAASGSAPGRRHTASPATTGSSPGSDRAGNDLHQPHGDDAPRYFSVTKPSQVQWIAVRSCQHGDAGSLYRGYGPATRPL